MATNKKFLYLNISQSYWNYAMPYMTPTYPENIRLLGPSSWEEIGNQHTYRQTDHRNPTPSHASCLWQIGDFLYPALARFARSGWMIIMYAEHITIHHDYPFSTSLANVYW